MLQARKWFRLAIYANATYIRRKAEAELKHAALLTKASYWLANTLA